MCPSDSGKVLHYATAQWSSRLLKAAGLCICIQRHGMLDAVEHTQEAPGELSNKMSVPGEAGCTITKTT